MKKQLKNKEIYRKAVFVVVYIIKDNKPVYLILRRKKHWKGWEFSKGGIDPGEKEIETARREAHEESGLKVITIKKFKVRGKYRYSRVFKDRPHVLGQTYSLFAAQVKEGKVHYDPREHNYYLWLSFEEALGKLKHNNQKKCLKIVNDWLNGRKK